MALITFAHGEAEIDRLVRELRTPPGIPALAPGEVVTEAVVAA